MLGLCRNYDVPKWSIYGVDGLRQVPLFLSPANINLVERKKTIEFNSISFTNSSLAEFDMHYFRSIARKKFTENQITYDGVLKCIPLGART